MNYFRYKQFNKDVIIVAVGYYLRYAFIKRLIKQFGKPQKIITDQAPSTKVAMAKVIETRRNSFSTRFKIKVIKNDT
jgi:transposase-like protein